MKTKFFSIAVVGLLVLGGCSAGPTTEKVKSAAELGQLTTIKLKVGGMTCTGCEKTIETGLSELEGVASVDAVWTDSTAVISADTTKVSLAKLESTIATLGYSIQK